MLMMQTHPNIFYNRQSHNWNNLLRIIIIIIQSLIFVFYNTFGYNLLIKY